MKILHLNVCSLLFKWEELNTTLLDGSIDVICLSETWLHTNVSNSLIPTPDFNIFRVDRKTKDKTTTKAKRGGGLCIFVTKKFEVEFNDTCESVISNENLELMYIKINPPHQKPIKVFLTYRPPSGNIPEALNSIKTVITKTVQRRGGEEILWLGDLNINILKSRSADTRKLLETGRLLNLDQKITEPTRVTKDSSSLIDIILYSISNHLPIIIVKKKHQPPKEKAVFWGRSYRNLKEDMFENDLLNMPLHTVLNEENPEQAWDIYFGFIKNLTDKYCPYRRIEVNKQQPPYITRELLKDRDHFFKVAKIQKMTKIGRLQRNRNMTQIKILRVQKRYLLRPN